jgi:ABC-2 type transport system ATP-binding protein
MTNAIELSAVSKRYRKYDDRPGLRGALGILSTRTERSWLWALRDVDFTIAPGESVGVIGRNGAGKSTLLQLLCGVTAPTLGRVAVRGRVAPLISVGVGFHPEMTGRENVYVNGTILGMSKRQIDKRFDDIVAFSELEQFIDTPVKFYSSGMFVRLGFSVAVEADPEVLLVDEVLAVGDFAFQVRCFERMHKIRANGSTIVVVSHNMNSIRGFCDRAVVMHRGRVDYDGSTFEAIARYFELSARTDDATPGRDGVEDNVVVESFELLDGEGRATGHVRSGDDATFRLRVRALRDVDAPFLWLGIESGAGVAVYSEAKLNEPMPPLRAGEQAQFEMRMPLRLPTGNYAADAAVRDALGGGRSTLVATAPRLQFYVTGRPHVHGAADLRAEFVRVDA